MHLSLKVLRSEVKAYRRKNPRVTRRLLALCELAKRQMDHRILDLDYQQVALRAEVSGRTLYRWVAEYLKNGIQGLIPEAAPGKKAKVISGWTAHLILEMRHDHGWGAEVICAHLRNYYGINLGRFVINRYLKKNKLTQFKRPKKPFNRHRKVVKVSLPGCHTQMDIKHLRYLLRNGQKTYVYNFVDHASRWQFKMAFETYGHNQTQEFFEAVLKNCPFKITSVQTDNGIEFTNKYNSHLDDVKEHVLDRICKANGIKHRLIPVGEKELNGLVERSHRMDDEQLYQGIRPKNLDNFNEQLKKYTVWTNKYRLRKAIEWLTPCQYLEIWTENTRASQSKISKWPNPDQRAA